MKNLYIAFALFICGTTFGQIQHDVNKTTGTASNPINDIDSIRFNAGQTEMQIILNNGSAIIHTISDINNVTFSGQLVGEVTSLDCAAATITGTLVEGVAASAVSAEISYTGGNGGPHNGQTVISTGVTGLTATLRAGNFANGAGTLNYTITGTPDTSGTASFAIQIGGMNCTLVITVSPCIAVIGVRVKIGMYAQNNNGFNDLNFTFNQPVTSSVDVNCDPVFTCVGTGTNMRVNANGFALSANGMQRDFFFANIPSSVNISMVGQGVHSYLPQFIWILSDGSFLASGQSCTNSDPFYYTTWNVNYSCTFDDVCEGSVGEVTSLNCAGANINGALIEGVAASGVSAVIAYSGGNGGPHNGQTVSSTGVTGLTATLAAGVFANGSGILTYAITGTPSGSGTASFALNIGGANCVLTVTVSVNAGLISTLNCAVSQTFTNSTVTAIPDLNCLTSNISVSGYSVPINTNQIVVSFTTTHASMSNLRLFIQAPNGSLIGLANLNNPNGGGAGTGCAAAPATLTNVQFGDAGVNLTGCPANNTLYMPNYLTVSSGCNYTSTGYTGVSPTTNGNTQTFAGTLGATYNPNGIWTLIVIDATNGNTGSLTSWSIIFPAVATITGTLSQGVPASAVSAQISYMGGNGGPHNGQTVTSTGVTGLTATLGAGNFANGAGTLTYNITGTPNTSGTASFAIQIGGISCTLEITVDQICNGFITSIVEIIGANGTIWMDRNLGASQAATSSTDVNAYGDLYQWGRGADGHQCRTSPTSVTLSSVDQPGNGNFIITGLNIPYDWRSPQNTNLWQGMSGVNNPCPSGYRLPTSTELDAERASWSSQNAAGAFASPLKLPMAGARDGSNGLLGDVGTGGGYWSSTVNSAESRNLYSNSSGASMYTIYRAYGYSVRCIKD